MTEASRILTIEDEPAIRGGIVAYLEDSGFEMLEADDGPAGIETFRRERPDAVLCDLRLPGIDGLEVLSTITEESPETPVIVVSGVSQLSYAVQALKRGAWDYVTKPIPDMGVLESAVRRSLERADLIRQNREYREDLEALNGKLRNTLEQLQQDEEAGRKIQSQLLPEDKRTFGQYVFSRRLYPSMYLSGDFVDYFPIDGCHIGFYMADVSGHGTASAFVTVMLKMLVGRYRWAFHEEQDNTILQPTEMLRCLNQDFCQEGLDKYLTLFYAILDREENLLSWCNGGQFPYPILYNGLETYLLSFPRSRPVGLFEEAEFHGRQIQLPREFVLLLVSDGILELLPRDAAKQRMNTLLAQISSPGTPIDDLVARFEIEGHKELPDDITFMTVMRHYSHG